MATSTPRLDSLTAGGTDRNFDGIRLADGTMLTLNVRPGAETAEVFLLPGLTAPDTEAWENEDDLEVWLTGGEFGDGSLYLDVPVQAVRDLIQQHGGEHPDQEGDDSSPEATSEEGARVSQNSPTSTEQAPVTRAEFDRLRTTVWMLIAAVLVAGSSFVIDLVRVLLYLG